MCVDFKQLNKYIKRENFPMPVIEEAIEELEEKRYFSLLDLRDGFYHISVAEKSIKYIYIICNTIRIV